MSGRQQRSSPDVVVRGVGREIGDVHSRAHQRGLVADRVHSPEQAGPGTCVAHVEQVRAFRRRIRPVRLLEHQVDPDHLVVVGLEGSGDRSADEARGAGYQHPHAGPGIS